MNPKTQKIKTGIPQIDLSDGAEMFTDFSREAQRHLIAARNALLILETIPSDKEAVDNLFKTFHTIKGLADFLKLEDICNLTGAGESLLNLVRKKVLQIDESVSDLIQQAINSLQKLLELLDQQIAHGGQLTCPYLDVGELIFTMQGKANAENLDAPAIQDLQSIPAIIFEPNLAVVTDLEKMLEEGTPTLSVASEDVRKILDNYKEIANDLKEVQSKLQERQRELIQERELALKLTQQAQSEARTKSEFLANMSHEIRTLINAILGFTDVLKEGNLTSKQREHVNTIIVSGKMMLGIVNDILDFSKVEAGKLKLEKIDFNLFLTIEEVFKIIRTRLRSKPISLHFAIDEKIPHILIGDPTRLKQIFINLLDNAIKFTEEGEIGLLVSINPHEKPGPDQHALEIIVFDSGIGIPEDRREGIFESFIQADVSTTRLHGGTGLGLTLVKTFVETMGGKIWVESQIGKGSKFFITLTLPEGSKIKVDAAKSRLTNLPDIEGSEIMIVDRQSGSANSLKTIFEELKLNVLPIAQSAKQASELLIQHENSTKSLPAIIFIDTLMPDKDAFMLAYKIKQQDKYQNIKLVALANDVKIDNTDEFHQAGFDISLARPVIRDEVIEVVAAVLGEDVSKRRILSNEMIDKISCEGIRVLVVEDSIPNQELLKVHLESMGCSCDYASNGQQAVDKLKENQFDICFMDLQMPVLNGIEATAIIRRDVNQQIPIIALTAAEIEEEKAHCFSVGMTDYLSKPFGINELKGKIIKNSKM